MAVEINISKEEYIRRRNQGESREQIIRATQPRGLGERALEAGTAVTEFLGGRAVAETFGAELAKTRVSKAQRRFIDQPSVRETAGGALQLGAMLIPGAPAAGVATRAGLGAATGLAMDVGRQLETGEPVRPGAATVFGGAIPVLGNIIGKAATSGTGRAARKLEEVNLRLTPVEKQNLERKGKDIAAYLAKKKIVGTPQQRYAKVNTLYNQTEDRVSALIKKSEKTYSKDKIIRELSTIPDSFVDDPDLVIEAQTAVGRVIKNLQERKGATITAESVQNLKRNMFKRAFAKNATDVVSDSRLAIGGYMKGLLDDSIPGLQKLNKEYGYIIAANRALQKATTRAEIGLVGKLTGAAAGTALGGVVGGAAGAAAGALVGPSVGRAVAGTAPRSALGAGLQNISQLSDAISRIPADSKGNVSLKAVLALINQFRE